MFDQPNSDEGAQLGELRGVYRRDPAKYRIVMLMAVGMLLFGLLCIVPFFLEHRPIRFLFPCLTGFIVLISVIFLASMYGERDMRILHHDGGLVLIKGGKRKKCFWEDIGKVECVPPHINNCFFRYRLHSRSGRMLLEFAKAEWTEADVSQLASAIELATRSLPHRPPWTIWQ